MYRILTGVSVAALLGLAALTVPASATTRTHDQSAANANVATDMSARRYHRRYYRHYGYRSYYGSPYYAYTPGPYYYGYGPRYYRPGISFGFGFGPGWW